MHFLFRFNRFGGHTHVDVFSGKTQKHTLQNCGTLVFDNEGWDVFRSHVIKAYILTGDHTVSFRDFAEDFTGKA